MGLYALVYWPDTGNVAAIPRAAQGAHIRRVGPGLMRTVVTVAGTHGYDAAWKRRDSALCRYLAGLGAAVDDGFVWSTDLGGVGFGSSDVLVWEAAGINLLHYVVPPRCPEKCIPGDQLVLLTHSHGLQVALVALAAGLKADLLIDVCGPVRSDLLTVARFARPNVRRWVHVHGGRRDRWQLLGGLFDGHLGIRRAHPLAHQNLYCPEADHDDALTVADLFPLIGDALTGKVSL